jgi:drug/metabolite transporter (DMT)-like permease
MPLVSVLAGWPAGIALPGERMTWNEPVGAAIIVTGAALTQARRRVAAQAGVSRRCQAPVP